MLKAKTMAIKEATKNEKEGLIMNARRFEVIRISRATGYSGSYSYNSLKKAMDEFADEINNDGYTVRIWDNKKEDFALWQY